MHSISEGRVLKHSKWLVLILLVLMILGSFARTSQALLPEPPNIIYGVPWSAVTTVTAQISGNAIASYTMGSNPNLPSNTYVLVIPIDALDPQTPGTARPGNVVDIYFGGVLAGSLPLSARGTVHVFPKIFLLWTK